VKPDLVHRLVTAGSTLVVTGAGVGVASGLPTFRGTDPDAVWSKDVMERGTWSYFIRDPLDSWLWYLDRFAALSDAEPNPAHEALAEWEAGGGDFLLVTQNIDGLHRAAGSRALVEVHGRADRVRCTGRGCRHGGPRGSLPRPDDLLARLAETRDEAHLPECPSCGALLRPHVLWFDERYDGHRDYRIDEVLRTAKRADVILFVGTSFSVGVTEMILDTGLRRGAFLATIDPSGRSPHRRMEVLARSAEEALPMLLETRDR
jgi:NAD-dependent deacetylase